MVSVGMAAIVAALSRDGSSGLSAVPAELCAEVLGLTGIAVSVLVPGGGDVIWRTTGASARLDDLQFTLGQGPGVDAAASGELILEPDLQAVPPQRWPAFTAARAGVGSASGFRGTATGGRDPARRRAGAPGRAGDDAECGAS